MGNCSIICAIVQTCNVRFAAVNYAVLLIQFIKTIISHWFSSVVGERRSTCRVGEGSL